MITEGCLIRSRACVAVLYWKSNDGPQTVTAIWVADDGEVFSQMKPPPGWLNKGWRVHLDEHQKRLRMQQDVPRLPCLCRKTGNVEHRRISEKHIHRREVRPGRSEEVWCITPELVRW